MTLNPKKAKAKDADAADAAPVESSSQTLVLHRQQALSKDSGVIIDLLKRRKKQKGKKVDELGREDNLSVEAKLILQNLARAFIEGCFNRAYCLRRSVATWPVTHHRSSVPLVVAERHPGGTREDHREG